MTDVAPTSQGRVEDAEARRRDLLAELLVERFTIYRPTAADDRSRKGAA